MAKIKAFKALRPIADFASEVAALPYDVVTNKEAREIIKNNPYSFLKIDRPEVELGNAENISVEELNEKAGKDFHNMIKNKVFIKDVNEAFYVYSMEHNGNVQKGLAVCTSIDDYLQDIIKKHEHTLYEKEIDRINHVIKTGAHTGPIMMTYKKKEEISKIIDKWTAKHKPIYDLLDEEVLIKIWAIDDGDIIQELTHLFEDVESLYIADGHHRAAAAVKVGQKMRKKFPNYTGREEFNFFLSVLFPSDELTILDYNRLIKDLNNKTDKEIVEEISEKFEIFYQGSKAIKPTEKYTFSMYMKGRWFGLRAKADFFDKNDLVKNLDVSILHDNLISEIFDIKDPRKDERIEFVGGTKGLEELQDYVDSGKMKVAFVLYPTSIDELMNIAETGNVMPPKSTWFEPKLRSGLLIHTFMNE
ncbi:MAG TPA: DUF1015 domain-containing protein [Thermoanaerobacterales bacterium]|nr:DUF1015 domain-containing protein [Thermoanaerobacterales bacterium]